MKFLIEKHTAVKEEPEFTTDIEMYCVIRNSDDQGMDKPKFFNNFDKAKAYFDKCVAEEKEDIEFDEFPEDIELLDDDYGTLAYFGYYEFENGKCEIKLYGNKESLKESKMSDIDIMRKEVSKIKAEQEEIVDNFRTQRVPRSEYADVEEIVDLAQTILDNIDNGKYTDVEIKYNQLKQKVGYSESK